MSNRKNRHIVLEIVAPVFELQVGEETYSLCYDVTAISTFFGATEINPIFEPIGQNPLHHVMLIWAGLRTHHPDLEVQDVSAWFTPKNTPKLMEFAFKALHEQTLGMNPEEADGPADPPSA